MSFMGSPPSPSGSVSKPLVNIKIAGKWMLIPLKMVLIGIDPTPSHTFKVALPCSAFRCPSLPKRARSEPGRCCRARCTEGSPMSCCSTVTASRRHSTMAQQGPLAASFTWASHESSHESSHETPKKYGIWRDEIYELYEKIMMCWFMLISKLEPVWMEIGWVGKNEKWLGRDGGSYSAIMRAGQKVWGEVDGLLQVKWRVFHLRGLKVIGFLQGKIRMCKLWRGWRGWELKKQQTTHVCLPRT